MKSIELFIIINNFSFDDYNGLAVLSSRNHHHADETETHIEEKVEDTINDIEDIIENDFYERTFNEDISFRYFGG